MCGDSLEKSITRLFAFGEEAWMRLMILLHVAFTRDVIRLVGK